MSDLAQSIATAQAPERRTAHDLVASMQGEFAKALPATLPVERFMRVALTELRQNPQLGTCTPESLLGALLTAARLGLEVGGPRGEFYLTPRRVKGTATVVPIVGYQGLLTLARRAGVGVVKAFIVREGDVFHEGASSERGPFFDFTVQGDTDRPATGVLAVARVGDATAHAYLSKAQVEARRKRGGASDSGPWATDWEAMARKTALRELTKELPASTDDLAQARVVDEQVQTYHVGSALAAPAVLEAAADEDES